MLRKGHEDLLSCLRNGMLERQMKELKQSTHKGDIRRRRVRESVKPLMLPMTYRPSYFEAVFTYSGKQYDDMN
jgi:hypothetical protein